MSGSIRESGRSTGPALAVTQRSSRFDFDPASWMGELISPRKLQAHAPWNIYPPGRGKNDLRPFSAPQKLRLASSVVHEAYFQRQETCSLKARGRLSYHVEWPAEGLIPSTQMLRSSGNVLDRHGRADFKMLRTPPDCRRAPTGHHGRSTSRAVAERRRQSAHLAQHLALHGPPGARDRS